MSFNDTNIRWTDKTWNPVHGCSKTGSPGCANCYAERVSLDLDLTEKPWLEVNAEANIQIKDHYLNDRLGEPWWVFVNSMSDLYHPNVPDEFVVGVYDAIANMEETAFQILTKHAPDNDRQIPEPPKNAMVGVSVGHPDWRYRIDWLRDQPATTKFISFEPLVAVIPDVDLTGIDWAIIGGESGPNYREMDPAWARNLLWSCRRQDVPVFFKQQSDLKTETRQTLEVQGEERRIEEWPDLPDGVLPKPRKHISPGVEA
jgi:protein gp37